MRRCQQRGRRRRRRATDLGVSGHLRHTLSVNASIYPCHHLGLVNPIATLRSDAFAFHRRGRGAELGLSWHAQPHATMTSPSADLNLV